MKVRGQGPIPARLMLIGEAPGVNEEEKGVPFVGASGEELNRMLHEAGIMRSEAYTTNVCKFRPPKNDIKLWIAQTKKEVTPEHISLKDKMVLPVVKEGYDELTAEINMVQPNLIIAFGNLALWALTDKWGILRWRGSQLETKLHQRQSLDHAWDAPIKVIPTIHPASVLREFSQRPLVIRDLRRAQLELGTKTYKKPQWKFQVRPTFSQVLSTISSLLESLDNGTGAYASWDHWLDFDLETKQGHIDCAGISWSKLDALCIPFMTRVNKTGYWNDEEEATIIWHLFKLLMHPKIKVRGQNLLFDSQYTYRHWHFVPNVVQDTMISHHSLFAALRKSLDLQASLYCEHYVQWKPEKSAWRAAE